MEEAAGASCRLCQVFCPPAPAFPSGEGGSWCLPARHCLDPVAGRSPGALRWASGPRGLRSCRFSLFPDDFQSLRVEPAASNLQAFPIAEEERDRRDRVKLSFDAARIHGCERVAVDE